MTTTPDSGTSTPLPPDRDAIGGGSGVATSSRVAAVRDIGADVGVLRLGARCGLFAAAATAGALAGFALGAGDLPSAPFAATGRMIVGVPASAGLAAQAVAVVAGALLHCAIVVAWAIPFAAIARRRRGTAVLFVTATVYSAAAYLVSAMLLPELLRLGHGARAFPPQIVLLYAVLAIALGLGMRLAFSGNAGPSAASHS